jgi:hypothetical protein
MSASYAKPIPAASSPFARSSTKLRELQEHLSSDGAMRTAHGELEGWLDAMGAELMRLLLQEHLDLRAAAERRVRVVGSDGVERVQARSAKRTLETIFGEVETGRLLYQAPGHAGLAPLDAELNLPTDHFSHGVRRIVAKEVARASFDEVVEALREYSGAAIAKRQVEELAVRAARDFDAFYEQRTHVGEASDELLVISTDGKGIVMRHEDLREGTRLRAENSAHKLQTRLTQGEKADRKRVAQVATVYSVARWERTASDVVHTMGVETAESERPRPTCKRVWASIEKHSRTVIREAFQEAQRRDPERRRRWVVLVDGDRGQIRAVKEEAVRIGAKVTIIIDVVHVLEYLWLAARALFGGSTPEAERWVGKRLMSLLTGRSGGDIARLIRQWASRREDTLSEVERKAIKKACTYLANRSRTRLMKYADALRDGLPIATGVIEGACRYLVKDRMDRTGARWSLEGAEAVLRLRALRASDDFDSYWEFHLACEKKRNHDARYANAMPPDPLPPPRRPLRRVK